MYTKNITIREGLKTLKTQSADNLELSLVKIFVYGVSFANDTFAIPALQELICRDASDLVAKHLDALIGIGAVDSESVFATTLASALCELDRTSDPLLIAYGKAMRDGAIFMGPTEWLKANAERYRRFHRSGIVQNAKPWAKIILFPDGQIPSHRFDMNTSEDGPVIPEEVDDE